MKVYSKNHVYECLPPYLNNRQLPTDQQIVIGLKAVTFNDQNDLQKDIISIRTDFAIDKAAEKIEERNQELSKSKFKFIKNLNIEGIEGEIDFDAFIKEAPLELAKWVSMAIMSTEILTLAERKNFLPESSSV